ncbi:hypothetical protein KR018_001913, partial [Drosophila ironensis]
TTKEAYFASLAEWTKQASMAQNAMIMFPYYLLANYMNLLQGDLSAAQSQPPFDTAQEDPPGEAPVAAPPAFSRFRVLPEGQQMDIIQRYGGYEYVVAPFWKRGVAEIIDTFILYILKVIVTVSIVNLFELEFPMGVTRQSVNDDDLYGNYRNISYFISMSPSLILIEILTKVMVCCFEALCTVFYDGATPGKSLMEIRILYVEAVVPHQAPDLVQLLLQLQGEAMLAMLYPAQTPTLLRAFARAVFKNLFLTMLFPICVVMLLFRNNRTAYDMMTKTIVVETYSDDILRDQG